VKQLKCILEWTYGKSAKYS